MAYKEKVLDHYENPRNVGSLNKADKNVGTGLVGAPSCGDVMKLQIKIDEIDGNQVITDAKFKTFGCGSAIASSSYVTEIVKNKTIEEVLKIKNSDIAQELDLPPVKWHCSVLAEDAIKAAINDYQTKQNSSDNLNITITNSAINHIKTILNNNPDKFGIVFSAQNGGCSGKKYKIDLITQTNDMNNQYTKINNSANINVYVNNNSIDIFKNSEIDFIENNLESKFIFNNPNAQGTCGCGESFS